MKTLVQIAIIALTFALGAGPAYASASGKVRTGNKHYKKGAYEDSLHKYREAEMSSPNNPVVQYNLGDALYKLGDHDEAEGAYNRALSAKNAKMRARTYYNLGNNAVRQEKYEDAVEYYKRALDYDPDDVDTKYNLELLLSKKYQQGQKSDKNKNGKNRDKSGKQDNANKDGKDNNDKNGSGQEQKDEMSKEDAERILQYYNEADRNSAEKRKMKTPRMPKTDEDW
ncbi:MAG: tetratricopeptide repeat protein [Endomicrobiales bacterium]|nr:tetratricopeptide repeat protein [Endomicrobiales bacterium]